MGNGGMAYTTLDYIKDQNMVRTDMRLHTGIHLAVLMVVPKFKEQHLQKQRDSEVFEAQHVQKQAFYYATHHMDMEP